MILCHFLYHERGVKRGQVLRLINHKRLEGRQGGSSAMVLLAMFQFTR